MRGMEVRPPHHGARCYCLTPASTCRSLPSQQLTGSPLSRCTLLDLREVFQAPTRCRSESRVATGGISHWPAKPESGSSRVVGTAIPAPLASKRPRGAARIQRRGEIREAGRAASRSAHSSRPGGRRRGGARSLLATSPICSGLHLGTMTVHRSCEAMTHVVGRTPQRRGEGDIATLARPSSRRSRGSAPRRSALFPIGDRVSLHGDDIRSRGRVGSRLRLPHVRIARAVSARACRHRRGLMAVVRRHFAELRASSRARLTLPIDGARGVRRQAQLAPPPLERMSHTLTSFAPRGGRSVRIGGPGAERPLIATEITALAPRARRADAPRQLRHFSTRIRS